MTDTDIRLPLTPARIGRGIGAIVEQTFPLPRQEDCVKVGEMVRRLTAYAGELVQAAYNDAARSEDARLAIAEKALRDMQSMAEQFDTPRDASRVRVFIGDLRHLVSRGLGEYRG